ncbi:hypothetical protein M979_1660 [Buttiauxella noackiae ATCC 51607]|uniref:HD-CE domain-containing protein n=1 Tax=Buttiauxella noackiae ATCC 51607 TaxID=1354255 RepID=A0A1B7HT64_9ENTR|nr:ATP-binding protein [Buttiauxella noackiae]OAT18836.1 hypothetical protein M979_1660 [Buttiauxella noackiae ATCC 51607]
MSIEDRLRLLAQTNSNYSLLLSQWEFDKKLIHRALNSVATTFPHYSLHDSSHSSTILTQIEKIILPDIDSLSATDCWLLLESCYWHDAGMIITKEQKLELVKSPEFRRFLDEHIESDSDLIKHAIDIKDKNIIDNYVEIIALSDSMTFIIADFFRKKHPELSGRYVSNPQMANINSPRNYLIPSRLFGILSKIVACHGQERDEIIKLPHCNDGMDANDYAHPRYVAALLRLGDLLDIDDGRFCETLLASIGDIPKTSHDHKKKHSSITSLLINNDIIEIEAICSEYGSYNAQISWFDYIREEFEFQKNHWLEICPNNKHSSLPIISKLDCQLIDHIGIDNLPPKITLDEKRVYEYITSSAIYNEKYPFIREIVQNAIDATMYKCWGDLLYKKNGEINDCNKHDLRCEFENHLIQEQIEIHLEPLTSDNEYINYIFRVRDYATGMSIEDIKKVLKVGSPTGSKRKRMLEKMPDWAKPTGFFGIGLQSVFTMCHDVSIKTRCPYGTGYQITIIQTNSNPDFIIKKFEDEFFHGTEVKLTISELKIPRSVPFSATEAMRKFDPFHHDKFEIAPSIIKETLAKTFITSPIKVLFNNENVINNIPFIEEDSIATPSTSTDFDNGVDFNLRVDLARNYSISVYYKNSKLETKGISFGMMGVAGFIDIFSGNAGEWVTINRTQLKQNKNDDLAFLLDAIIQKHKDAITQNTENKNEASFYFHSQFNDISNKLWENYMINNIAIKDYIDGSNVIEFYAGSTTIKHSSIEFTQNPITYCLSKLVRNHNLKAYFSFEGDFEDNTPFKNKYFSFNVKIINEYPTDKYIDKIIIQRLYGLKSKEYRYLAPCFDKKYLDISFSAIDTPPWVFKLFYPWEFENYLVMPHNSSSNRSDDARAIYGYYKERGLTSLDVDLFTKKYISMWEDLGL